jgi:hypothetical protein
MKVGNTTVEFIEPVGVTQEEIDRIIEEISRLSLEIYRREGASLGLQQGCS